MTIESTELLYKNLIQTYLYIKLGRQPTENEILEEAKRCECENKVGIKTDPYLGMKIKEGPSLYRFGDDEPLESDMIAAGHWPKKRD